MRWRGLAGILVLAGCCLAASPASSGRAERWFVGGNYAFRSTTDEIRSNAAISIGPLGDDGIPNTGDPGEVQGCESPGTFCDPRPDYLLNSPTVIGEGFQFDVHAGFLPVKWLSVQLDAGYFKSDVGPVDAYLADHFPVSINPADPSVPFVFHDREVTFPLHAGQITEIPVSLSFVARFRSTSPVKPYLGAGIGRIFTDMGGDSDLPAFNERVSKMRIRSIADQFGKDITPHNFYNPLHDAIVPVPHAVTVELSDTSEWHLTGGVEWMLGDSFGVVFDARYTFAPGGLRFNVSGHDQIDLLIWSEKIYRPDGTLAIFNPDGVAPNTLCFDSDFKGIGCDFAHKAPGDARVNPEGIDPLTNTVRFHCPARGDFDKNGSIDVCYGHNVFPSDKGFTEPRGDVIIQGGEINLTAFTISVGLRYHF